MWRLLSPALLVVALVLLGGASCGGTPPERVDGGRLGTVLLYRPPDRPAGDQEMSYSMSGITVSSSGPVGSLKRDDH